MQLRAACTHCERLLDLTVGDIMLLMPMDPARPVTVAYECPACGAGSGVAIDPVLAAVLQEEGAIVMRTHPSLRGARRPVPPPAGPITYDDLLDFHQLLEQEDGFDAVEARSVRRS